MPCVHEKMSLAVAALAAITCDCDAAAAAAAAAADASVVRRLGHFPHPVAIVRTLALDSPMAAAFRTWGKEGRKEEAAFVRVCIRRSLVRLPLAR